jgi:hypothetical protein
MMSRPGCRYHGNCHVFPITPAEIIASFVPECSEQMQRIFLRRQELCLRREFASKTLSQVPNPDKILSAMPTLVHNFLALMTTGPGAECGTAGDAPPGLSGRRAMGSAGMISVANRRRQAPAIVARSRHRTARKAGFWQSRRAG